MVFLKDQIIIVDVVKYLTAIVIVISAINIEAQLDLQVPLVLWVQ